MKSIATLLSETLYLIAGDAFAIGVLFVVMVAAVLAFGFGVASDLVGAILILGLITAFVESKLREKDRG
jgi:hypothetical protein